MGYVMIRIALCDDISEQLELIEEIVSEYVKERGVAARVHCFHSGAELLEVVKSTCFFDIYLLDMIMPEMKGIDVGMQLRAIGDEGKIIYTTATADYAVDSYSVGAFYYMLKPISVSRVYEVLDRAIKEIEEEEPASINVKTKNGLKVISTDDILYVDIVNRSLAYHLKDENSVEGLTLRVPFMEAVASLLGGKTFVTCGASVVINVDNVDAVDREKVTFKGGSTLFPSKNACASFYEKMKEVM